MSLAVIKKKKILMQSTCTSHMDCLVGDKNILSDINIQLLATDED